MTIQLELFADPETPRHDRTRNGPCGNCGAVRPDDYTGHMFLEPVSGECHECNMATLAEIIRAGQAGDRAAYEAAWARHYPGRRPAARARKPGMDWRQRP